MAHRFKQIHFLSEVKEKQPTCLAIGSFDGVHRGHQAVLQSMVTEAKREGMRTAVLTFFPHPKRVVQQLIGRHYITTLQDRVTLLGQQGIDLIITHPFNNEVRLTRAADFVTQLCGMLDMRQLWGGNFALGYNREGDVPFLRRLGEEKGYIVRLVEHMITWQDMLVSSSRIRRSLTEGDMADVNGCLERRYHLMGTVIEGAKMGRQLGFPTANLLLWEEQLLPANGVYATYAWVGTERYVAATNVGVRPTVDGQALKVEAHLLDFEGDLYGRPLRLEFVERVRLEQKFAGLEALKAQIAADVREIGERIA